MGLHAAGLIRGITMLIVQKYGGSSVADAGKIARVAGIIAEAYRAGNAVVVVLSAQGDTTDELIEKAKEINPKPSKREMDVLLTVGEQVSVALMAMELEKRRLPAVSLTGWQIGMRTDANHGASRIRSVSTERIRRELDQNRIVLVAGFQGIDRYGDITTLGRGGSDTTAVAIAAALGADKCQIYTDVDGVYTADPRIVPNAGKLEAITYDEMLELASLGSQVLHNRSVELAKRYHVELEVLSSYERKPGTMVREVTEKVERMIVSGVAKDAHIARITVAGLPESPDAAFRVFSVMARAKINVDIILQSAARDGATDISFTVAEDDAEEAGAALEQARPALGCDHISVDRDVAKVSVVGAGMMNASGMAVRMFEALADAHIHIQMISSSEIKLSAVIARADADRAVQAVHEKYFS